MTISSSLVETQNTDTTEATVTQHFAYLHGVLQNVEKQIINSLREHKNFKRKNIDAISTELREYEEQLQSAIVISTSIKENLNKIDIKHVIDKLKALVNIPCHLIQNDEPANNEIKLQIDNTIVEAIEKHCNVHIPEMCFFSLQRTDLLPENYEIEPLIEEMNISKSEEESINKSPTVVNICSTKNDDRPTIGSSEMIRITHVLDPSCFYVQTMQNQQKISELSKGLATLANTTGIIPTEITLNALYIAQYSKDKNWYRARVIDKKMFANDDERYTLLLIDYGITEENVPLIRIRNIIPQFAMLPVMVFRCTLFEIVPNNGKWHSDATKAFKKLVCTNSMVSMCIKMITGDTYYVDLCVISSKDSGLISVKEMLTFMKYATSISPNKLMRMNPDSTRRYYKEQLELETFSDVQIVFVESPSSIYIQRINSNRYFYKIMHEMTDDYEKNISATEYMILSPCKDLPCAARGVNGYWHRGLIREVTENTVQVFYVDVGYTLILSYNEIRSLPRKYMTCRTQAIKVTLKNIKSQSNDNQWEPETIEFIKKFLMDAKSVKIVPFSKVGDTYNVVMFTTHDRINVADLLVQKHLAAYTNSSSYNTSAVNKSENKKNKSKKNASHAELPGKFYDPMNISSEKINEDPFKVSVLIHQAQSPDSICVSESTCDHNEVEQMMKQMQEFYGKYRAAKRDVWTKDITCAVYLAKSEMYYRGRIVDIKSDDRVIVFLYDIGIEETVSMNDIQSLYPFFSKISTYVFKIKLTGILPCGGSTMWPSLSCEKLHEIINNNQTSKFYISKLEDEDMEDSAIPVELWIKEVKIDGPLAPIRYEINSVNRMLIEKGVALPVKEYAKKRDKILAIELKRQLEKRFERLTKCDSNIKWFEIKNDTALPLLFHSDSVSNNPISEKMEEILDNLPALPKLSAWLPAKPIEEDTFVAIPTYLDHYGFLYLHSKTHSAKILEYIEMKLEKLYTNCPTEYCDTTWIVGNLCIAQYHANKKWYRGKIVAIEENDIINVEFVDYGNVEECTIGNLKKKIILENIPIQCTKCLIDGLNPGTENGLWRLEDLDRIHNLLIERECEVTIINRTEKHLVISLTILPNKYCKKKTDLIEFLINEWKINIKPNIETNISENSIITNSTPDVVIENSRSFCSDDEVIKDPIISGNPVLLSDSNAVEEANKNIADVENLSWYKLQNKITTSTPIVASEEDLSMNYKLLYIPKDIEYIELEMCCSINSTKFYAQLKENNHSTILNTYYTQYKLLMNDLQNNADKQPVITNLTVNTPCCAKFTDDLWYRCLITESEPILNSNNIEIKLLYVDYGNDEYRKVDSQECELYTLKKEWLDIPAIAIKCKLWNIKVGSTANPNELLFQLATMYNKRVIAKIKETDEEFTSVELYEDEKCEKLLYNTLIEEGLFEIKQTKK
ncbi:hypothetical protein K0M31_007258 [Melipona bicolor]|uniref:Tudor domain-containing protein n=1 Tax=Melipona bicolor TaxID=60889 RepID=A0AA40KVJ4_9HYME|nr:hypothetical protein K0M31_007258 [Melipona bicolor]